MSKSSDSTALGDGSAASSSSEVSPQGDHDSFWTDALHEDAQALAELVEDSKLLSPRGLSGSRPWDDWDEEAPVPPLSRTMLQDFNSPPGLAIDSVVLEAEDDTSPQLVKLPSWGSSDQVMHSSDEPKDDLQYDQEVCPVPSLRSEDQLWMSSVCRGGALLNSEMATSYVTGEEESPTLQSESEMLAAENVRLVMENELLRNRCYVESSWGIGQDMSAALYWSDQSSMNMDMYEMPSFYQLDPWCMSEQSQVAGNWQEHWAMPPCSNRMQQQDRPARARTDSDIGVQPRLTSGESGRMRTMSDISGMPTAPEAYQGPFATVMLRNLPNNYSRSMLLKLIDSEGFVGEYDFIYLPMDFKSHASLGYAFVNFMNAEQAQRFFTTFEGFSRWVVPSQKVCSVNWSHPYQGLEAHIERYRNSPVMHEDVPDDYKPMVFRNGKRIPFPEPTKKLKVPRMRPGHDKASLQEGAQGEEQTLG